MRLLLDTNAFLWFVEGNSRLSDAARNHIEDTGNEILLSVTTLWEMAIKISLGKLEISIPLAEFVQRQLDLTDIELLNINQNHAYTVATLPFHHRDPFDRMLVAQCLTEHCTIVSPDGAFGA